MLMFCVQSLAGQQEPAWRRSLQTANMLNQIRSPKAEAAYGTAGFPWARTPRAAVDQRRHALAWGTPRNNFRRLTVVDHDVSIVDAGALKKTQVS